MTGRELRGIRKRLGYTQEAMADALGISQSYYAVLERGRRRISEDLGTRALSVHREPVEWKWFDYGYSAGRDLAAGLPRGYERRVRPTAILLAAEQAFQRWLYRKNWRSGDRLRRRRRRSSKRDLKRVGRKRRGRGGPRVLARSHRDSRTGQTCRARPVTQH
jgi:transcriptional regulator with XRE-family HTH domain